MYATLNFKTKKQLKNAVTAGIEIRLFAPGIGKPKDNGIEFIEGPHYPDLHKWYAQVDMRNGLVVAVR